MFDDVFGDKTFIRVEMHNMGYGYNVESHHLDDLKGLNNHPPEDFIEFDLISGSTVWCRRGCISDFSISTPESRKFYAETNDQKPWE